MANFAPAYSATRIHSLKNICIFASGSGSNAEALINHFASSETGRVTLIVSDQPNAGVLARADRLRVPYRLISKAELSDGNILVAILREAKIDLVVLGGFLRLLPSELIQAFPNAIVNIHPSLLPKFGGKGMYGQRVHQAVVEAGEEFSGITIHYVNEHYDEGEVIFQAQCPVLPNDDAASLAARVLALEHEHFPQQIEKLLQ